jgi:EXLDI family protein
MGGVHAGNSGWCRPAKTIYVSDDDLPLYQRAQELAGGNLSAAISTALRRYVEIEEGRQKGYDEITVRVGPGRRRRQRFSGVLLGEWGRSTRQRVEVFRVYRARTGKFVVHVERSAEWTTGPDSEKWSSGWRSWVGNWSSDQTWGFTPEESTLHIADTLDELRELLPAELYDAVADAADQPPVEDLDI